MDQTESLSDMDWSSPMISGMMCTYEEEADEAEFMMAQLLSNIPISSNHETTTTNYHHHLDSDFFSAPSFWPSSSAAGNTSCQHLSWSPTSRGGSTITSYTGSYSATSSSQHHHHHHHHRNTSMDLHDQLLDSSSLPPLMSTEDGPVSMRLCVGGVGEEEEEEAINTSSYLAQSDQTLIPKMVNINITADQQQKHQQKPADIIAEGKPCKGPKKKRSRTTGGGGGATKAKKNVRSKKGGKKQNSSSGANVVVQTAAAAAGSWCTEDEFTTVNGSADGKIDEATPTRTTRRSSSNVSSEGDPALNLNGKTRASRGAATDPQSLYARKRRERINERLKVLQTLVPNGTKVDISTMLEEAVEYVKFLQLQIKLLSSDDHWMYAPIAYNGMNIGLDLKVAQHI